MVSQCFGSRPCWRRTATIAITVLLLAGCSGGGDDSGDGAAVGTPAGAEETDSPNAVDEGDRAILDAAQLKLTDFPTGWSAVPSEDDEDVDDDLSRARSEFVGCVGAETDEMLDLGGPKASTDDFTSPGGDTVNQTVAVVDEATAVDFMSRFVADGVAECLTNTARGVVEAGFAADPEAPDDVVIGDVTVGRLNIAPVGDESAAYRITIPISAGGFDLEVYIDMVAVRVDRALSGLNFESTLVPFPAEDIAQYAGLAASRMSDALVG